MLGDIGDTTRVIIPLNCISSLLSGKCRICHASTGMTNKSDIQPRTHITQDDGGFDHAGYPYCSFSYPCAVCGEQVEVEFSGDPEHPVVFVDRCGKTVGYKLNH